MNDPAHEARLGKLPGEYEQRDGLVGHSSPFVRALSKIPLLAGSDATVMVTGETGTGKELFAQAIHNHSLRRDKPFIPVNCGALPEHLIENELFGHARGAYTGAAASGKGLLAEAEGGTLFLDELNSLCMSAQAKLLRFLQSREYRMLGSTRLMRADVRIIAATNTDLRRQVRERTFREDLYHRLYVLAIELPSLRARADDIPLLAQHFLSRYAKDCGRGEVRLSRHAIEILRSYEWPGNVRELQSVMQRSVLLSSASVLQPSDIDIDNARPIAVGAEMPDDGGVDEDLDLGSEIRLREGESFREAKERVVRQFERAYLHEVLAAAKGNVTRAAKLAGMQRRDLQRLLRKHDVSPATVAA